MLRSSVRRWSSIARGQALLTDLARNSAVADRCGLAWQGDRAAGIWPAHRLPDLNFFARQPNVQARFCRLSAEPIHNRFLLTNLGGIKCGAGLYFSDEKTAPKEEFSLMIPNMPQHTGGELL